MVWVLQNQDGNSTLFLIDDPKSGTVSGPRSYAVASATVLSRLAPFATHRAA
jgi:hypothetical protein